MKVLDFHIHMGRREHLTPHFIAYYKEVLSQDVLELMDGITPQAFNDYLASEGVEKGVLLCEYSPFATGVIPSEFTAQFCRNTSRLIPFGSIDLDSEIDAGLQTEKCIKDLGCRGLKLLPSYGRYYPNDPRILPAYEAAQTLGVPIMFHTGTSLFPGTRVRYANPLLLDDVADDFPDLDIIMCHGGRPFWYREAAWMLMRHKRVYIDISGIPPKQLPGIFPKLEQFADRFVFGSDWPNIPSIAEQARRIRELPLRSTTIDAILWDNGARLLGLDS